MIINAARYPKSMIGRLALYRAREQVKIGPGTRKGLESWAQETFERILADFGATFAQAQDAWAEVITELDRLAETDTDPAGNSFPNYDALYSYLEGFITSTINRHFGAASGVKPTEPSPISTPNPFEFNPADQLSRPTFIQGPSSPSLINEKQLLEFAMEYWRTAVTMRGLDLNKVDFKPVEDEIARIMRWRQGKKHGVGANSFGTISTQEEAQTAIILFIDGYLANEILRNSSRRR